MACSSGMHREVIKWLQTLELTSALTNPRRDLMNGYTVAEILNRYDAKVQLHSYDTGAALARRLDNWTQLEKYLKSRQCKDIPNSLVRSTLMGENGAALQVLEKLYTFLTKRPLKHNLPVESVHKKAEAERPAFMRPTAAELVRLQNNSTAQRLRSMTGEIDEDTLVEKNATVVRKQRETVFTDKMQHHERYERQKLPMKTLIALAKGQRDGTYMGGHAAASFDTVAGGGAAPGSATAHQLTSSRARQRLAAAKQLDLRTHNPDLVSAFQQRQQHERDEQFRSHFDPDEDICRALSRVVAKPLQQSGHFAVVLELAGMPRERAEAVPALECAPSSPKFPRYDIASVIVSQPRDSADFPVTVLDACFEQLHGGIVKHNAAKLLQQRPDDVVHLVLLLDLALDSGNSENFVRVCHMLEEIGSHLARLDPSGRTFGIRDEIIAGICPRLAADELVHEIEPGQPMAAFVRMLVAFTNVRDAASIRRVLEHAVKCSSSADLVTGDDGNLAAAAASAVGKQEKKQKQKREESLSEQRAKSLLPATFFHCMTATDLKTASGVEELATYHAVQLIQQGSAKNKKDGEGDDRNEENEDVDEEYLQTLQACGWEIFRCLAPACSSAAATAVHYASKLAVELQDEAEAAAAAAAAAEGGESGASSPAAAAAVVERSNARWETIMLALSTVLTAVIAHHAEWSDEEAEQQRKQELEAAGEDQPLSGSELLDVIEVTAVRLFQALVQQQQQQQQRPQTQQNQQESDDAGDESYAQTRLRIPACFCAVAPLLRSDLVPSVSVAFVQHFLVMDPADRDAMLVSSSPSEAHAAAGSSKLSLPSLPSCTGKADVYVAGGLASLWPVEELLLILKVLQQSLSSLQVIEMLAALLVDETVPSHQAAWEDALRFAKADLANAARNPVELREVPDALLPRCQQLAAHVVGTLYPALNPEEAAAVAHGGAGEQHDDDEFYDEDGEDGMMMDEDGNPIARHGQQQQQQQQPPQQQPDEFSFDSPNAPGSGAQSKRMPFGAIDWLQSI